jgi:hypothetical protein
MVRVTVPVGTQNASYLFLHIGTDISSYYYCTRTYVLLAHLINSHDKDIAFDPRQRQGILVQVPVDGSTHRLRARLASNKIKMEFSRSTARWYDLVLVVSSARRYKYRRSSRHTYSKYQVLVPVQYCTALLWYLYEHRALRSLLARLVPGRLPVVMYLPA